jgi:formate dehydrogenase maturation protein FdhE
VTLERIIQKLDELEKEEGQLTELLQFYRRILQIQAGVGDQLDKPSPGLNQDTAKERLGQGEPLLHASEFAFDWTLFQNTLREVNGVFSEFSHLFGLTPEVFREPVPEQLVSRDSIRAWYAGEDLPHTKDISQDIMRELIHAAVRPFLMKYAGTLIGFVEQKTWRRNYCPVCGGTSDFAYLEPENGARWLLCSRCDTEWLYQRLQCPYCQNQDQNDLSFYSDDDEIYRLYVCEKCKRYLKTIDLRKARSEVEVSLERLLTYELDAQAREYGYLPIG